MTYTRTGVCAWCGATFTAPATRGPLPRYCRPSHRQRAFEARTATRTRTDTPTAPPHDDTLTHALDQLAAALADSDVDHAIGDTPGTAARYQALRHAARDVVVASGRPTPAVTPATTTPRLPVTVTGTRDGRPTSPDNGTARPGRPTRAKQPKVWKVVQHRPGTEPTEPEARTVTAHPTETAALTAARQLGQLWARHQGSERDRWTFTAIADPTGDVAGEALPKQAAQQWAQRLQVPVTADTNVVYQRRLLPDWPPTVIIERVQGHSREPLNQRWHRGPGGYPLSTQQRTTRDAHPYLADLVYDACELAYLYPAAHCLQLLTVLNNFATDWASPRLTDTRHARMTLVKGVPHGATAAPAVLAGVQA